MDCSGLGAGSGQLEQESGRVGDEERGVCGREEGPSTRQERCFKQFEFDNLSWSPYRMQDTVQWTWMRGEPCLQKSFPQ